MSKGVERFRDFFANTKGKSPRRKKVKQSSAAARKRAGTTPPRVTRTARTTRTTRAGETHRDPLRERAGKYMGLLAARDVQGLVEVIVQDLDKEAILKEVATLRRKYPRLSNEQLCRKLISEAANTMSVAAVANGLAWAVPGVGIATGAAATAAEMVAMIVYQSRLVVSVAAVYGHDIHARQRARDVLVCVASSTAGTAVQMGVRTAARWLAERMARALARRTASAMVKSVPIIGAVAGVAGGAAGAVFNRMAVRAVGRYAVQFYGQDQPRPPRKPPLLTSGK